MTSHEGGCLCNAVRYAVDANPIAVHICFCKFCQRSTGTNSMVEPLFTRPTHAVIQGIPTTFNLPSAGSGKNIRIHFCSRCGTKIFQEFERFPDLIGVYSGTFDDPGWFDRSPAITRYIFLESAQDGTVIPPGYNTFEGGPRRTDGTLLPGTVYHEPKIIKNGP